MKESKEILKFVHPNRIHFTIFQLNSSTLFKKKSESFSPEILRKNVIFTDF